MTAPEAIIGGQPQGAARIACELDVSIRAREGFALPRGGPCPGRRIPAIVATLATDGWDRIGFNG
jgi:hypothetical protein